MRYLIGLMIVLAMSVSAASGQERGFGLGIMLGEPSGINAKLWVSSQNAVDAGLAWSFRNDGYIHIHADYLWHFPHLISSTERLVLYAGIGGRLGGGHDAIIGARIPIGIEWWPKDTPLDIFLELAPILDLVPATELSMNGGIGIRFFFR